MILSAQSIRWCCTPLTESLRKFYGSDYTYLSKNEARPLRDGPLIEPFTERGVIRGRSYGLSACTYDCRIAHPLVVPVGQMKLAVTMERFNFPPWLCGSVLDKSSWARVGLSAMNTHLDAGFVGHVTLELTNFGIQPVELLEGDAIVQIKFELLDSPTELPYSGKYNNQPKEPVEAKYEVSE